MRKTRLVILPGVRSITQIGCLLLFLACPTIAFKGQEKRDVEPICKVHELKYWWLPFDTGERESSLGQTRTRYDCQREDTGIMKGKDNATDSIPHTYDESMISHGHAAICGQEASYNSKTNFGREKRWLIYSPTVSSTTDISSRRNSISQRRMIGRSEMLGTLHKTERISSVSLERSVAYNNDHLIGTDSQSSSTRKVVSIRLQRDSREGSVTRRVNERRQSFPNSLKRDSFKQTRLSSRTIPEFTFRYRNIERTAVIKENNDSHQGSSEQKGLSTTLEGQENNKISTLPSGTKYYSGKHQLNNFTRLYAYIQVKREFREREERLSNDVRRVSCGRRELILERTSNQQDILQRTKRSDRRSQTKSTSGNSRLDRRISENKSAQQRRQRSSAFFEQRGNDQRTRYVDVRNEQSRMGRMLDRAASIDIEQRLANSRSVRQEARVFSLNRRTTEPNIRPQTSLDSDSKEHRETSQKSVFAETKPQNLEERSKIGRRIKRATTFNNGFPLSERGLGRSIESQVFSTDRRMTEINSLRNTGIDEKGNTHRMRSDILRESNTLRRLSLQARIGGRQTTQKSAFAIVQPRDSEERSRINRRHEGAVLQDKEKLTSDERSERSVESIVISRDRRMTAFNLRHDIKNSKYVRTGRIRSEMIGNTRNDLRENTVRRPSSLACLERRSTAAINQPKFLEKQSNKDRRIACAMPYIERQRLFDYRSPSVESREFSLEKGKSMSNFQKNIGKNEKEPTHLMSSDILIDSRTRESVLPLYQNTLRRNSLSSYQERRERIRLSRLAITQPRDTKESRMDRKFQRTASIDNERQSSNIRSLSSADSHSEESNLNLRKEIRNKEKESSRRIRMEISKDSRYIIHENAFPSQNIIRRKSAPARMERREINKRSTLEIIQPKEDDWSRTDRRLGLAASINREQPSFHKRSLDRFFVSGLLSSNRGMNNLYLRRDGRKIENLSNRKVRSEILRDMRNETPENISIRRQRLSARLEGREITQLSRFAITQPKDFVDKSRVDRKLQNAVSVDNERRMSGRRSGRSVDSLFVSTESEREQKSQQRVNRRDESNLETKFRKLGKENTRRFDSETLSIDSRHGNRENVFSQQNILQRQKTTAARVERREIIKRSANSFIQPKDSEDRFQIGRRVQRAASIDREKRSSDGLRIERSAESRVISFDRRMDNSNIRRDVGIHKKENNREIRLDILREPRIGIRRESSLERRETTQGSLQFAIISPEDFESRSKIDRRQERSSDRERSQRSVEFRRFSLNPRIAEWNLRQANGKNKEVSTRRIISEFFRDTPYGNRGNIPRQRNKIGRYISPSILERREKTHQARLAITQANDSDGRSRTDRRLEGFASMDRKKYLYDERRSKRSVDSRVVFDRRMDRSNLRHDVRIYEKESNPEITPQFLRESRIRIQRQSKETIRPSLRFAINTPEDFQDGSKIERSLERALSIGSKQCSSDRRMSQHSVEFCGFSFNRRMAELNHDSRSERTVESRLLFSDRSVTDIYLRRDGGKRENVGNRRIRSEIFRDTRYGNRENIPPQRSTIGRSSSPSILEQRSFDRRTFADSRVFAFDRSEFFRESRIGIRRQGSWVRRETIRRSLKFIITSPHLDKEQKQMRGEKYMENEDHLYRRRERMSEFINLRRNIRDIRDTSNNQKDVRSQPEIISTVQRRVTYDSLRISKIQETDGNKKHISSEDRQMRDEAMTPIVMMRRDMNHIKQSIRSSMHSATSPATYTSYPERKSSHTGQKPVITATISRTSRPELLRGNLLVKSQTQDETQLFNAQKSTQLYPSWIGLVISAIKMAVIGSTPEEYIFSFPKDSVLARHKYHPGHEQRILKLRPISENSDDKGHLLQDFVLGSVVAGYFISSIHLKIRDYRNSICIF